MKSRGGVRTADMDSQMYAELGDLMKEFPDWKQQHPELHAEMNPIRYTKNRVNAPKAGNICVNRHAGEPSKTDYQATYTPKHGLRPRSSKRPPPSPRDLRPPPMTTKTVQQDEFRPKFDEYEGRPPLFKKEDNYQPSTMKFETQTGYSLDYPAKTLPVTEQRGPAAKQQRKKRAGQFHGRTTNKETFKSWKPERQVCYTELPSFTGSVLYPNQSRNLETTTATTFKGAVGEKPEPVRIGSPNIKIEGDREFDTVNRSTYKHHGLARPASMIINKPEITNTRSKFDSQTMNSTDYGFKKHRPPKPCTPPRATIDLKFNNKSSYSTEQRQQFPGIDVTTAPAVVSYKPGNNEYRPPSQKFETQTKHQLDYRPIDVSTVYQPPTKPPSSKQKRTLPKFVDTTTSKEFFRRWETEPRKHYGDIHEALQFVRSDVFVPTKEKFNTVSTTKETYKGTFSDKPDPFLPPETSIERSGDIDFNTMYRTTYEGPQMEKVLSKSQAAKLLNELRKRKVANVTQSAGMGRKPVAANC